MASFCVSIAVLVRTLFISKPLLPLTRFCTLGYYALSIEELFITAHDYSNKPVKSVALKLNYEERRMDNVTRWFYSRETSPDEVVKGGDGATCTPMLFQSLLSEGSPEVGHIPPAIITRSETRPESQHAAPCPLRPSAWAERMEAATLWPSLCGFFPIPRLACGTGWELVVSASLPFTETTARKCMLDGPGKLLCDHSPSQSRP